MFVSNATLDAIIVSDIHLGADNCEAVRLLALLSTILKGALNRQPVALKLIVNGDLFDSLDLRRLPDSHWRVLELIRCLSGEMDVIWTLGNHDGEANNISHLLGVKFVDHVVINSGDEKVLVVHGHIFDRFILQHPVLSWAGDAIYGTLQKLDPQHRLARWVKLKSKIFIACSDNVQHGALEMAKDLDCSLVVCGHTHHARITRGPVVYANSGCWTENPPSYLTLLNGDVKICRAILGDGL